MESGYVTTPFGRRPMSLALLARQQQVSEIAPGTTRNKWKLFRSICEARNALGVNDRALTVLDALLSFYPHDDLSDDRKLVVFPSNAQLSIRARGMAPATLRRHLAVLVDSGLILRKDSPNGKRYARRGKQGDIDDAFGFSLAPLLSRAEEIEAFAEQVIAERTELRLLRERVTLSRRDLSKLIAASMNEGIPGAWETLFERFHAVVGRIPRIASVVFLRAIQAELDDISVNVVNLLENHVNSLKVSANASQDERHIQDSKLKLPSESEIEPQTTTGVSANGKADPELASPPDLTRVTADIEQSHSNSVKTVTLPLVLKACPQISDYGPLCRITSWKDLEVASHVIATMLGINATALNEAKTVFGPHQTAIIIACILERTESIRSAGAYMTNLTRRAMQSPFSLEPMLMALLRARTSASSDMAH
jgi:replication initiation protein RepC